MDNEEEFATTLYDPLSYTFVACPNIGLNHQCQVLVVRIHLEWTVVLDGGHMPNRDLDSLGVDYALAPDGAEHSQPFGL